MCGILFTTKKLGEFDMEYVLKFLKNRGPDSTCIKRIQNYSFVHTLLSMTGPPTEQPFYNLLLFFFFSFLQRIKNKIINDGCKITKIMMLINS